MDPRNRAVGELVNQPYKLGEPDEPFGISEWLRWAMAWAFSFLKFSTEGLVQQRLLQRLQRGKLLLVEAGEALGFGGKFFKL